ncbi:MAG: hypothetical protein DI537_10575 [Stutzerimonas stutzeri]|nr:MAG: hypothetical protein DI537_10575 [Stutzerimonas stutzeri]
MSADKHRSLARRVAWLRYFAHARVTGVKGYPHITDDILRLEKEGLLKRNRVPLSVWGSGAGRATTFERTAAGEAFLTDALRRFGPTFGPPSAATNGDRPNKQQRALRRGVKLEVEPAIYRAMRRQAQRRVG